MTIVSLIGAIFNTLKGIDVEETFILLIVLAVLYMLRKGLYVRKWKSHFPIL